MERKFKEGDIVHKTGDRSQYYQVVLYEPNRESLFINRLLDENYTFGQSEYWVTCKWNPKGKGEEIIQFMESDLTKD